MLAQIISNTPLWVWGLFCALLALGFSQTRARQPGLRRVLILPVVMAGLSLFGTVSSFAATPMLLLAWCAATGIAVLLVVRRPVPAGIRYDRVAGRYDLPGSWMPMALIMGIFSIKYAVGVSLALHPALAGDEVFAASVAVLYGFCGGIFLGSAVRLWRLAKHQDGVFAENRLIS